MSDKLKKLRITEKSRVIILRTYLINAKSYSKLRTLTFITRKKTFLKLSNPIFIYILGDESNF